MIQRSIFYTAWLIVIYFALYLASIALSYFNFDLQYGFLKAKQHMLSNQLWVVFFFVHLFFGALATLSGWPLFFSKLIAFRSKTHQRLGQLYVYSILFFTGPQAFIWHFLQRVDWGLLLVFWRCAFVGCCLLTVHYTMCWIKTFKSIMNGWFGPTQWPCRALPYGFLCLLARRLIC